MGIFENKLGGRVCVAGYAPWENIHTTAKTAQLKNIMQWLSKDTLPAYVASYHKINLWVREPQDGNIALAFTNSSFDEAENLTLKILTDKKKIEVYDMDCKKKTIRSKASDGPYKVFVIPSVDPWEMRLVTTK